MISRILITIGVYCVLGKLLCDIDPGKEYTWYSGIWHGLFLWLILSEVGSQMLYIKLKYTQLVIMSVIGFLAFGRY